MSTYRRVVVGLALFVGSLVLPVFRADAEKQPPKTFQEAVAALRQVLSSPQENYEALYALGHKTIHFEFDTQVESRQRSVDARQYPQYHESLPPLRASAQHVANESGCALFGHRDLVVDDDKLTVTTNSPGPCWVTFEFYQETAPRAVYLLKVSVKQADISGDAGRFDYLPTFETRQPDTSPAPAVCTPWRYRASTLLAAKDCDVFRLFPLVARKYETPLSRKAFLQTPEAQALRAQCPRILAEALSATYCMKLSDLSEYDLKRKGFPIVFDERRGELGTWPTQGFGGTWFSGKLFSSTTKPARNVGVHSHKVQRGKLKHSVQYQSTYTDHVKTALVRMPEGDAASLEGQRKGLAVHVKFRLRPAVPVHEFVATSIDGKKRLPLRFVMATEESFVIVDKESGRVVWPTAARERPAQPSKAEAPAAPQDPPAAPTEDLKTVVKALKKLVTDPKRPYADVVALAAKGSGLDFVFRGNVRVPHKGHFKDKRVTKCAAKGIKTGDGLRKQVECAKACGIFMDEPPSEAGAEWPAVDQTKLLVTFSEPGACSAKFQFVRRDGVVYLAGVEVNEDDPG